MARHGTGTRTYTPLVLAAALLLLPASLALPPTASARGATPLEARVPDVRRLRTGEARRRVESAGFKVGKVYELSRERILRSWRVRYPIGYVFMQAPSFEDGQGRPVKKPIGTVIHFIVAAARDGANLPSIPGLKPATSVSPRAGSPRAAPSRSGPRAAAPEDGRVPPPAPAADTSLPVDTSPAPRVASGSPDAPRVAPPADPDKVPALGGLELAEAEQLVREAKMKLYVERVGGHPIGRVLEQIPAAGSPRPAGDVIKVIVTAGGDFQGELPGAPVAYLARIEVPSLLDRTVLQARRILADLSLTIREEQAKRGLAGRVMDQMPPAGAKVAKGGVVRVWIAPDDANAKPTVVTPPPLGPLHPAPAGAGQAKTSPKKAPQALPLQPGPLPGGIPQPISPGVNTSLPKEASVPVGFTWRGVKGATAYLLEIEEEGAEGRWMANARKPSRTTAVLLDVERLDPKLEKRLRWRVRAVIGGREGKPSKWILLH